MFVLVRGRMLRNFDDEIWLDGKGFDSIGDAMRSVAMQYDATPCHATPWDWMEFDGTGSDAMRRDAMGLDFFNDGWISYGWLLVGLRRWRGVLLLARRSSTSE